MANILIIDDEVPSRRILGRILERENHSVYEADQGTDALELMRTRSVDLVITDLFMPGKDGIETIMELRSRHTNMKIIAVSGGGEYTVGKHFLDAARAIGADRALPKPLQASELIAAVHDLLRRGLGAVAESVRGSRDCEQLP